MSDDGNRLARELANAREADPEKFDAARPQIEQRINQLLPREKEAFQTELKRLLREREIKTANPTFAARWTDAAAREIAKRQR